MMAAGKRRRAARELAAWTALALVAVAVLLVARRDRSRPRREPAVSQRTIRLPVPDTAAIRAPADIEAAAADLERSAAEARRAGEELERLRADLEARRADFEALTRSADADAARHRQELEDAQRQLEEKRSQLERGAREAEARVRTAGEELERLQARRLELAAAAGVAQGLTRGQAAAATLLTDPRRLRDPARQPFVPDAAAVAAAAARPRASTPPVAPPPAGGVTVAGDAARAEAALVRAQADAAVDSSIAAINAQTAQALALENRLRATETYFEARRINRVGRALEAGPPVTMERAVRIAALGLPPRLSAVELDPLTGAIRWPAPLADPRYDDLTASVQDHFRRRASSGGSSGPREEAALDRAIDELVDLLKRNVADHAAGKYGRARTFLDSLRVEFSRPPAD